MSLAIDDRVEWLETDGLGGFASGTTSGVRTRRYHAILLAATTPPTGRFALVNGLDVVVRTPGGEFPLSFHRYTPDVTTPTDSVAIESFTNDPWPRWIFRLRDGTRIAHELFVTKESPRAVATWRLLTPPTEVTLRVRPLLSGRDYHALHHENAAFRFDAEETGSQVRWQPYPDVPATLAQHDGRYTHAPVWYRGFQYDEERDRGFEFAEDLASPGIFEFDLGVKEASLILCADLPNALPASRGDSPPATLSSLRAQESLRRAQFATPLERAADAYLVRRGSGRTILAGYPWFADWGRDTFISIRGLCLATGRLDDARDVLLQWAGSVCVGMLPNRFVDSGDKPEYNSVDAALWYVIAVHELCEASKKANRPLSPEDSLALRTAAESIVTHYAQGTAYGIGMDADGLLRSGVPGVQLTWMDSKIGSWVVTPRHGKPVEVQALWLNALRIAGGFNTQWREVYKRGVSSFRTKFWSEAAGCLYDVIEGGGPESKPDASIRPNQILAIGGLPVNLLRADKARAVVDAVERSLLTPLGLRSLAPGSPDYRPRYSGDGASRDAAYHQGTVWPWLMGPFIEAWVRVRGDTIEAREEARQRLFQPMLDHLNEAGLGHISEIADGDQPHTPRGCPFQAWSVAELLRVEKQVLARPAAASQPMPVSIGPLQRARAAG